MLSAIFSYPFHSFGHDHFSADIVPSWQSLGYALENLLFQSIEIVSMEAKSIFWIFNSYNGPGNYLAFICLGCSPINIVVIKPESFRVNWCHCFIDASIHFRTVFGWWCEVWNVGRLVYLMELFHLLNVINILQSFTESSSNLCKPLNRFRLIQGFVVSVLK